MFEEGNSVTTLSDHYFGDLEAFDEASMNIDFF